MEWLSSLNVAIVSSGWLLFCSRELWKMRCIDGIRQLADALLSKQQRPKEKKATFSSLPEMGVSWIMPFSVCFLNSCSSLTKIWPKLTATLYLVVRAGPQRGGMPAAGWWFVPGSLQQKHNVFRFCSGGQLESRVNKLLDKDPCVFFFFPGKCRQIRRF